MSKMTAEQELAVLRVLAERCWRAKKTWLSSRGAAYQLAEAEHEQAEDELLRAFDSSESAPAVHVSVPLALATEDPSLFCDEVGKQLLRLLQPAGMVVLLLRPESVETPHEPGQKVKMLAGNALVYTDSMPELLLGLQYLLGRLRGTLDQHCVAHGLKSEVTPESEEQVAYGPVDL